MNARSSSTEGRVGMVESEGGGSTVDSLPWKADFYLSSTNVRKIMNEKYLQRRAGAQPANEGQF